MGSEIRRISQSEMKTFLRCRRKWWLSEIRRLAPKGNDPTGPLRSGSRVHTALEAVYTPGEDPFDALVKAQGSDLNAYFSAAAKDGQEYDQAVNDTFIKDCELERIMLEGYLQWIAEEGVDAGLEVISTEEVITVPGDLFAPALVEEYGDFQVVGKIDMRLLRVMDGKRLFLDHKTAQSLTMNLPSLQQDPQMLHYHWLEWMTGTDEQCDGALYNVLKKVKRTKAAKPPFYARYEIHHNKDELLSYEIRMREIIRDMFELERKLQSEGSDEYAAQLAYPNPTRDCSWDCQFFNACTLFDDGSRVEDMLRDQFVERNPLARYDAPPPSD
jgi:hypothetical protein